MFDLARNEAGELKMFTKIVSVADVMLAGLRFGRVKSVEKILVRYLHM